MTLEDLGFITDLESYRNKHQLDFLDIARVISEHKERYVVRTPDQEFDAELLGNLRFTAEKRSDFPAVGDWVAIAVYHCKFKDCTHTSETGCAVISAVESGEVDKDAYNNYLKMEREKAHFESTLAEKRQREKKFGKIMKDYKKNWRK